MRLRIPELAVDRGLTTAYALSKASDGKISLSAAYRLYRNEGRIRFFDSELLDALCETLKITKPSELGQLFEMESVERTPARRARRKA